MINTPFVELDVHGMTADEAVDATYKKLEECGSGVYKLKVIHGFNRGTRIKSAICDEFKYGYGKVKRIAPGENQGITELILRD